MHKDWIATHAKNACLAKPAESIDRQKSVIIGQATLSDLAVKPPTSGGGYKAIVKCDEFCYTHLTIFNVLHSTVKLRLNCEYAVT